MLAQDDEDGVKKVLYYISQTLVDAETIYCLIEKLCLTLYFSSFLSLIKGANTLVLLDKFEINLLK